MSAIHPTARTDAAPNPNSLAVINAAEAERAVSR